MRALEILQRLLQGTPALDLQARRGKLPPHELRWVLEYQAEPDLALARRDVEALLGTTAFLLEPLSNTLALNRFAVLRFPQLERTLGQRELFAIGYELADALGLVSAEPELGVDVYADPRPPADVDTVESAVLSGLCWVNDAPPADRLWALKNIRADAAWQMAQGAGIVVAQPDTGIAAHDELPQAMLALDQAADVLEGDPDPTDPLDPDTANPGHGTGTASVLASPPGGQVTGAAPRARVAPIRCITDVKVFNTGPVAAAIAHATQAGCDVISMSLGGVPGRALRRAIRVAIERHQIVLAAAGNCVPMVVWPAKYSEVIAVGGSNAADVPWKGSSAGSAVDICAPAELVWRAERDEQSDPLSTVAAGQGTSFATALVAGVAALWLSHHGRAAVITEAQARGTSVQSLFRTAVRATARRPAGWETDRYGAGIVDARALLELGLAQLPAVAEAAPQAPGSLVPELLDEEISPGPADTGFDAPRYELEIAAIALAQSQLGARLDSLVPEAKVQMTRPSPQLAAAAAASSDARLRRFGETPQRLSITRPLALSAESGAVPLDLQRLRLAVPREAGLESTGGVLDIGRTREYLAHEGGRLQLQRAESVFRANPRLDDTARSTALDEINQAIDAIARGANTLSRPALVGFEALVRLTGRPALRVRDGSVDLADARVGHWHDELFLLLDQSQLVERMRAAGRIDADGAHMGSGSVVGPGLVLTNRHVLQAFAAPVPRRENPERWELTSDAVTIDFAEEPSSATAATRFRVTGVVGAGASYIDPQSLDFSDLDAALLTVETTNAAGKALPQPVGLVRKATRLDKASKLLVVGYPARPGVLPTKNGEIDLDVVRRLGELFGLDYGTKYVAPGEVASSVGTLQGDTPRWVVSHDATTLGGNSGSCIFDFAGPQGAVALHFGGGWLRANYAHSLGASARAGNVLADPRIVWRD
jgi:lambda repressor-like predicted transcriptional regulator